MNENLCNYVEQSSCRIKMILKIKSNLVKFRKTEKYNYHLYDLMKLFSLQGKFCCNRITGWKLILFYLWKSLIISIAIINSYIIFNFVNRIFWWFHLTINDQVFLLAIIILSEFSCVKTFDQIPIKIFIILILKLFFSRFQKYMPIKH